jgi:DNA modification methylase
MNEHLGLDRDKLPTPYYEELGIVIYHGDCREILPHLPKVDLVLTDPPYGINVRTDWTTRRPAPWAKDSLRVHGDDKDFQPGDILAMRVPTILFGANHYADKLPPSKSWMIWDKRRGGSITPGWNAPDAELAWSNLECGCRLYSHLWEGYKRDSEIGEHYHPTQKPIALMKWCLQFMPDAQLIIDPFMGSGTTLRAAKDLGRKCIGIEIEEKYCAIAVQRLRQEVLPL